MRKIDERVREAVKNWKPFRYTGTGETEVKKSSWKNREGDMISEVSVALHGNVVFRMNVNETKEEMNIVCDNCGWNTQTKVARIRAALSATNIGVTVRLNCGKVEFTDGKNSWLERYESGWSRR